MKYPDFSSMSYNDLKLFLAKKHTQELPEEIKNKILSEMKRQQEENKKFFDKMQNSVLFKLAAKQLKQENKADCCLVGNTVYYQTDFFETFEKVSNITKSLDKKTINEAMRHNYAIK